MKVLLKQLSVLLLLGTLASCQSAEELKREQYFAEGYQLYHTNCANCHQADGEGMASLYPPLNKPSAWQQSVSVACLIKHGMRDTIMVNGNKFSRPMPGNTKLTDLEIAEIITYMRIKWATDSTYTPIDQVKAHLDECAVKAR